MPYVSDLRVVLRGRDFRRLFGTRLVSQFSDGIFQFAVAGYAFFSPEKQTSVADVAAAFAVLLLPYSIIGPFAGVFIDRWSRRQILVIGPLVRGVFLFGAAAAVAVHAPDWVFYAAAFGVLGVNRFFLAALGASLPHVVPADQLMMANAVTPTSGTVATFIGAGAGFVFRFAFGAGYGGTAAILVISGLIFGSSSLIAATMARDLLGPAYDPARPQTREALRNVVTGLRDGARHVLHRRSPASALGSMAAHRLLYGMSMGLVLLLYRYYFTDNPEAGLEQITGVVATSGVGYFLAALVTPWATQRFRIETWIPMMLLAAGVLEFALCVPFREPGFLVAGFVLGITGQSIKICTDTVVQRDIEDAYLGRIFSIYDFLFNGMFVVGVSIAALLLPPNGRSVGVLALICALYGVSALGYRLIARPRVPVTAS
ncbi:MFS transporter [Acrocarpospora phusangensis]|uniref:MFS transporter n=1 Tax=Acrocarpospora phusangensis TaxID=1070424 RepID=A0A919UMD8_9ACTN|nr:MFS transporter [Acrocarpospora phusangensis]GIH23193.1 MFS transporter [Acrocarpospora phusangensis]